MQKIESVQRSPKRTPRRWLVGLVVNDGPYFT